MRGIVNWYSERKGIGLIEGNDGKDAIVYKKDIPFLTLLHAGDNVEYTVEKTGGEFKARNIKGI